MGTNFFFFLFSVLWFKLKSDDIELLMLDVSKVNIF